MNAYHGQAHMCDMENITTSKIERNFRKENAPDYSNRRNYVHKNIFYGFAPVYCVCHAPSASTDG